MKATIEIDIDFLKRLLMLNAKADPTGLYDGQNREETAKKIAEIEKQR